MIRTGSRLVFENVRFALGILAGRAHSQVKEKIMGEMDRIEKIMAIGQAAREWSQAKWSNRQNDIRQRLCSRRAAVYGRAELRALK